jgi:hypothetical protein
MLEWGLFSRTLYCVLLSLWLGIGIGSPVVHGLYIEVLLSQLVFQLLIVHLRLGG